MTIEIIKSGTYETVRHVPDGKSSWVLIEVHMPRKVAMWSLRSGDWADNIHARIVTDSKLPKEEPHV